MKGQLTYIELKTGYSDDGPAWVGLVEFSKTGQTLYFDNKALKKRKIMVALLVNAASKPCSTNFFFILSIVRSPILSTLTISSFDTLSENLPTSQFKRINACITFFELWMPPLVIDKSSSRSCFIKVTLYFIMFF